MNMRGEFEKPVGSREWYDWVAELGAAVPFMHLGGEEATDALLEMCNLDASSCVLDVGCGVGNTACLIAERYGSRVEGMDISEVMVAKAQKNARDHGVGDAVRFRVADVFELPFVSGAFDVVLAESVLTPLPGSKVDAIREMARVMRPGGLLGVNETIVDSSAPEDFLALADEHPAMYGCLTAETLRELICLADLQVLELVEKPYVASAKVFREMGFCGVLRFMFQAYPRILGKLLGDARFRRAAKIDDAFTKRGKAYLRYALLVAQRPD